MFASNKDTEKILVSYLFQHLNHNEWPINVHDSIIIIIICVIFIGFLSSLSSESQKPSYGLSVFTENMYLEAINYVRVPKKIGYEDIM